MALAQRRTQLDARGRGLIVGAVFAIAFASDGQSAMSAAPNGVFRFEAGRWTQARAPDGAIPARAIAVGASQSRIYLLGRSRLFISDDGGQTYDLTPTDLADQAEITSLAVATEPREVLLAVVDGEMATSGDAGRHWRRHAVAPSPRGRTVVSLDPYSPPAPGRPPQIEFIAAMILGSLGEPSEACCRSRKRRCEVSPLTRTRPRSS